MSKDKKRSEYSASMRITSKTIDLDYIADVFRLAPKISWSIGHINPHSRVGVRRQENYRCFEFYVDKTKSIEHNLIPYLDLLEDSKDYIDKLWRDDGSAYIDIYLYTDHVMGHVFKASFLRRLADLKIELGVTVSGL